MIVDMAVGTRVRPHAFLDAPELAERYVPTSRRELGPRRWCARCGLPGQPGDHRHPIAAELAAARHALVLTEASALAARIIGER
jgi:hypothetical protein